MPKSTLNVDKSNAMNPYLLVAYRAVSTCRI